MNYLYQTTRTEKHKVFR